MFAVIIIEAKYSTVLKCLHVTIKQKISITQEGNICYLFNANHEKHTTFRKCNILLREDVFHNFLLK